MSKSVMLIIKKIVSQLNGLHKEQRKQRKLQIRRCAGITKARRHCACSHTILKCFSASMIAASLFGGQAGTLVCSDLGLL